MQVNDRKNEQRRGHNKQKYNKKNFNVKKSKQLKRFVIIGKNLNN